jgi:hypothetical protein
MSEVMHKAVVIPEPARIEMKVLYDAVIRANEAAAGNDDEDLKVQYEGVAAQARLSFVLFANSVKTILGIAPPAHNEWELTNDTTHFYKLNPEVDGVVTAQFEVVPDAPKNNDQESDGA